MSDEIDKVQGWNELHLDVSLRNQAAKAAAERTPPPGFDGTHCVESACGEPVEPERLRLGLYRCAECQHYLDRVAAAKRRNGRDE